MLEWIAREARRWTRHHDAEVALVVPVRDDTPLPMAVSVGSASHVVLDASQVFRMALASGADSIVVAHNHRAGNPPSNADQALTRRLVALGALLEIPVRAHLVITDAGRFDCLDFLSELRSWDPSAAA